MVKLGHARVMCPQRRLHRDKKRPDVGATRVLSKAVARTAVFAVRGSSDSPLGCQTATHAGGVSQNWKCRSGKAMPKENRGPQRRRSALLACLLAGRLCDFVMPVAGQREKARPRVPRVSRSRVGIHNTNPAPRSIGLVIFKSRLRGDTRGIKDVSHRDIFEMQGDQQAAVIPPPPDTIQESAFLVPASA